MDNIALIESFGDFKDEKGSVRLILWQLLKIL
jgi:hypothetical protein